LGGDRGHPAQFQELGRGFPWAWDEEVVADVALLLLRQGARLEAACQVAPGALVEEVLHRGVPRAVDPGRESSDASDAKAVVVLDAARRGRRELRAQPGVLPQGLRVQSSPPVLEQRVSLWELLVQGL
jgi:hypothetical protein